MYFYDAIAPIVAADSIDWDLAFRASRWGQRLRRADRDGDDERAAGGDTGVGDYVNCPLNKASTTAFVAAVNGGRKVLPHDFEEPQLLRELHADRGDGRARPADAALRPDAADRPHAIRAPAAGRGPSCSCGPENKYLTAYNLVGFQTRLAYPEQQRIFAMIPALAPRRVPALRLDPSQHVHRRAVAARRRGSSCAARPDVRFAGLLTGVEGYIESCAMGLVVAWMLAGELDGRAVPPPPPTTMLGGLYHHVTAPREPGYKYGPTNVNYGLLPPLRPGSTQGANEQARAMDVERARARPRRAGSLEPVLRSRA